jgi:ferredoxin
MKKYLLIITSFAFAFLTNSCTKQNSSLLENEFGNANSTQAKPSLGIDLNKPSVLAFLDKLKISKDQVKYYNEVILPQKIADNLKYKNPYSLEQIIEKFGIERKDAKRVTAEKTFNFNAQIIKRYGSYDNWYINIKKALKKKELRKQQTSFSENNLSIDVIDSNTGIEMDLFGNPFYNIMDVLGVQGWEFSSDCEQAGCSTTCISYIMEGEIDDSEQSYLSDCERDGNWFLPCVTYQNSQDIRIGVDAEYFYDIWSLLYCD